MGAASDPEIFVTGMAQIFMAYPAHLVESALSPLSGLPSKHKFLPSLAEIKQELEERFQPYRALAQIAEAKRQLAGPPPPPRPTIEELRAKHGPHWGITQPTRNEWKPLTVAELCTAGNLTPEQWNALPNQPEPPGFQRPPALKVFLEMTPTVGDKQ